MVGRLDPPPATGPGREAAAAAGEPPYGTPPAVAQTGPARLGRLGPLLFAGHLSWALPANAAGTLLQALFADQRGDSKVAAAATITAIGAVASITATVAAGALSDLTRSRHGRRNPWILGGALVSATGLSLAGLTSVFALQVICFAVFQAGLGAMLAALYAIMPDRVAVSSLGKASALGAVGYLVGTALGGFVAAGPHREPGAGHLPRPVDDGRRRAAHRRPRPGPLEPRPAAGAARRPSPCSARCGHRTTRTSAGRSPVASS